jgi:hypothetical protein
MRERLVTIGLTALLVSAGRAAEVKVHNWGHTPAVQPLAVTDIPVGLDVGVLSRLLIRVPQQIELNAVGFQSYAGCGDLQVLCNCRLTLGCVIVPTGVVEGEYSAYFVNPDIDAPGGSTKLCIRLTEAQPVGLAGQKNITVALITLTVAPR